MKKLLTLICCVNLAFSPAALAAGETRSAGLTTSQEVGSGEFVSGSYPGAILMPVNLWGSVGRSGIHHIPTHTDLITLLSLAGGPASDALLDEITIKRITPSGEQVIHVDAHELLTKAGVRSPVLEPNDLIIVPRDKPAFSNNFLGTVGFVTTLLGIVMTGLALKSSLESKSTTTTPTGARPGP